MARIVIVAGTEAGQEAAAALMSAGHEVAQASTVAQAVQQTVQQTGDIARPEAGGAQAGGVAQAVLMG